MRMKRGTEKNMTRRIDMDAFLLVLMLIKFIDSDLWQ